MFSERFSNLPAYAFPRLRALLDGHVPGGEAVQMTIGEPQHPFPEWVQQTLAQHVGEFQKYPPMMVRQNCCVQSQIGWHGALG